MYLKHVQIFQICYDPGLANKGEKKKKAILWNDYALRSQGICALESGVMNRGFEISRSSI